jgi:Undecaprenyl-phosphate glucose phosphotransferase
MTSTLARRAVGLEGRDPASGAPALDCAAPATPVARKAARGARLYRGDVGRVVEVLDVFAILFCLALVLRFLTADRLLAASLAQALPMGFAALALWWSLREADGHRFAARPRPVRHALKTFGTLVLAAPFAAGLGAMAAIAAGRPAGEGASEALAVVGVAGVAVIAIHWVAAHVVGFMSAGGHFAQNVVIVGATPIAERFVLDARDNGDINIMGVFDARLARAPKAVAGAPVLGDLDALLAWPLLPSVDRVIVTVSSAAQGRVKSLVEQLKGMPNKVVLAIDMQGFDSDGTTIGKLGRLPVAYVSGAPEDARRAFWKRVQDVSIGTLALVLLSPLMLAVAIAIKLESPGPVFFRQVRHGFNNQPFRCWKFRSMRTDMTDHRAARQVERDDPRVTRVGRFIRATSIDELPQLFNVLAGEMSLVGPRPHAIGMKTGDVESEKLVADYAHRHRIKPGMTGWAAIHGSRGPVNTPEEVEARVRLDVQYIDTAHFWLDFYIMAMTIPSLLGDREAIR